MTAGVAVILLLIPSTAPAVDGVHRWQEYEVFADEDIQFVPAGADSTVVRDVEVEDKGRVVARSMLILLPELPSKIEAVVSTEPVPKNELSVCDPWDRAGNIRLSRPGLPDLEIVRFVTAYGGATEHVVDVTHLAPVLTGFCTFKGFVDTWVNPAWKMSFALRFEFGPTGGTRPPDWVIPLVYDECATAASLGGDGIRVRVEIPERTTRVAMYYIATGHATDGTDADEFVTKDNVISIDGAEVYRYRPRRGDCIEFRAVNPYTRRWSDGTWSSDHPRSGWCPGDWVRPIELEVSNQLTPGIHTVSFNVEDVRPPDEKGHFGYWRISSYAVGWRQIE